MAIKLINHYQAWWDAATNQGYLWFTYFDGERHRTDPIQPDNFRILLDLLRNETPVYGDHTVPMVTTQTEPTGEGEHPNILPTPTSLADLPNSDNTLSCFINFNAGALVYHTSNEQYVLKQQNGAPFILQTKIDQLKNEVLITDMTAVSDWRSYKYRNTLKADFQPTYEAAREVITTRFPNILLGSYLSGRQTKPEQHQTKAGWYMDAQSIADFGLGESCQLDKKRCCNTHYYPTPRTPLEQFTPSELITAPAGNGPFTQEKYTALKEAEKLGPFPYCLEAGGSQKIFFESIVDHRIPTAAQKLRQYAIEQAKKRQLKLLYSDNWSYITHNGLTWTDTANYLETLKRELHQEGIRLIINIWWPLGRNNLQQEMQDIERLAEVVDGLSIEGAFLHPNIQDDYDAVQRALTLTRFILQKGLLLIFLKGNLKRTGIQPWTHESMAAWAMMIRSPGDKLFVSKDAALNVLTPPAWPSWPQKYGEPSEECILKPAKNDPKKVTQVSRKFKDGTITLDLKTKAVT